MLKVWLGDCKLSNYNPCPSIYFNNAYESEWMLQDITKEMVLDIDKTELIDANVAVSPVLGSMAVTKLSGGVKTLILINNEDEWIFNASSCGDNCAKWLLKIGEMKDVTIRLGHYMQFPEPFEMEILNSNRIIRSMKEFVEEAIKVEGM